MKKLMDLSAEEPGLVTTTPTRALLTTRYLVTPVALAWPPVRHLLTPCPIVLVPNGLLLVNPMPLSRA